MIDYKKISEAIDYYKLKGYTYKDLPWFASEKAIDITIPKDMKPMSCNNFLMVGSAEQSFLDAVINDGLTGRFVSCTPCFRCEPIIDDLHHYFFVKVELFVNVFVNNITLSRMADECFNFYSKYLPVEIIKTKDGYDIVDVKNKIELGSYGIRNNPLVGEWVFGTGVSDPRLSYVIGKQ